MHTPMQPSPTPRLAIRRMLVTADTSPPPHAAERPPPHSHPTLPPTDAAIAPHASGRRHPAASTTTAQTQTRRPPLTTTPPPPDAASRHIGANLLLLHAVKTRRLTTAQKCCMAESGGGGSAISPQTLAPLHRSPPLAAEVAGSKPSPPSARRAATAPEGNRTVAELPPMLPAASCRHRARGAPTAARRLPHHR